MIAVKNEACVPVIKTSDEHLHVFTSTMPTQLPGLCCMPRRTTCFKKAFLANTHAPLLLRHLENGFVVAISLSILSITLPQKATSPSSVSLSPYNRKNSLLLPLNSCPSEDVKFGVMFQVTKHRVVAFVYVFRRSRRSQQVRLQATMMTMCALQRSFLENVAVPTVKTCLSH